MCLNQTTLASGLKRGHLAFPSFFSAKCRHDPGETTLRNPAGQGTLLGAVPQTRLSRFTVAESSVINSVQQPLERGRGRS